MIKLAPSPEHLRGSAVTSSSLSPEALLADIPALTGLARPATLLRPAEDATGTPGVHDSGVGGPLLWPADEPWPLCRAAHLVEVREKLTDEERETWQRIERAMKERRRAGEASTVTAEEAATMDRIMAGASMLDQVAWERSRMADDTEGPGVAMVPVLQLHARDVPGSAAAQWPEGSDVLQLLWCPNDHAEPPGQPHYWGPTAELRFRTAAGVRDVLTDPPRPHRSQDGYLPRPRALDPVEITDLPEQDELPEELHAEAERWAEERGGEYHRELSCRAGWKAGGWPSWHLTDLVPIDCGCGTRMRLLLTVDSAHEGPGVVVGRFGELRVFTCPSDAAHPLRLNIQ